MSGPYMEWRQISYKLPKSGATVEITQEIVDYTDYLNE